MTQHDRVEASLGAFPALVAVHRVIAAGDTGDLANADFAHLCLQLLEEARAHLWRCVAAIHKAMHEHFGNLLALRHFEQREQVVDMRVDSPIADEPHQVEPVFAPGFHHFSQHRIGEQRLVIDGVVNFGDVHHQNAAGADVQVADFAVAHLTIGQAHEMAIGADQSVRIGLDQVIEGGLAREGDSVACHLFAMAPAIEDRQDYGSLRHGLLFERLAAGELG